MNINELKELKFLKDDILKETNRKGKKPNKKIKLLDNKQYSNKINIIDNNIFCANYFSIFVFNLLIIINLYSQTISNKFNFYYHKLSKISLKISGNINKSYNILGNEGQFNFTGINLIKEVRINGKKQEKSTKIINLIEPII